MPDLKELVLNSVCSKCTKTHYNRGWGMGKLKMLVDNSTGHPILDQATCNWCSTPGWCYFVRANVI